MNGAGLTLAGASARTAFPVPRMILAYFQSNRHLANDHVFMLGTIRTARRFGCELGFGEGRHHDADRE